MNTKKRWIITAIVALALAAVVVTGIVLNHSADRVLKATDGTEAAAEGTEPAEEIAEEAPVEETLDLVLPGGENGTEISSPDQAAPENEVIPVEGTGDDAAMQEAAVENAAENNMSENAVPPDEAEEELETDMIPAEVPAEDTAPDTMAEGSGSEMITVQENTVEGSEESGSEIQTERTLITTDGEVSVDELQNASGSAGSEEQDAEEAETEEAEVSEAEETEKTEDEEQKEGAEGEEEEEDAEEEEEEVEEAGETELHATAADGAKITVRKLDGTFPAGATVKVFLVSPENAQDAVEEALKDSAELVDLVAYDITIYDKDGNEIVPDETVEVSITGASLENGEAASVYHIEDSGAAKKVTDLEDSAQASFKAAGAG